MVNGQCYLFGSILYHSCKITFYYLSRETKASCNTAHRGWHEMVQVAISWCGELQGSKADIVQSFIVDAVCFISVFDQLMDRQCSVVRLYNGVRYFWWWYNAECVHDSVGIFFSDLRNKKRSHSRAGSTAKRVRELKALKAIAALCFFTNYIKHRIYQFSSFSIVSFCPVVSGTALTWWI